MLQEKMKLLCGGNSLVAVLFNTGHVGIGKMQEDHLRVILPRSISPQPFIQKLQIFYTKLTKLLGLKTKVGKNAIKC